MDQSHPLLAISPVDGRYQQKTGKLASYFSEFALIKYRLKIEIDYFIALSRYPLPQLTGFPPEMFEKLQSIYQNFTQEDALRIKAIEVVTNHDVKAVEYFIKEQFDALELGAYKEFIHFGLTSQDINNTAVPLSLKEGLAAEYFPLLNKIVALLKKSATDWHNISMLAHTHGQPASPTRLGKEVMVFVSRLEQQITQLAQQPYSAKFGGATGNFNAHHVAYPDINWHAFADKFVNDTLGLHRSFPTTQIEHYDHLAAIFDNIKRINTILLDLCRDMWSYVGMNYFTQKIKDGEVGSSAMPHKVNPIDFENAEGNLGIANALLEHLSAKLPVSRLQRDLTDSTVLRNIGVPLAHTYLSLLSIRNGWEKLQVNESSISKDLEENWAVIAEAIQTVLRRESYPSPYEALKLLTRKNEKITQASIHQFIDELQVSTALKQELKKITPFNYTGI